MNDGQVSDLATIGNLNTPGLDRDRDASGGGALFAMPNVPEREPAAKRIRKSRAKPAPPTLADRLRTLALDGAHATAEAFELKSAADTLARIERLAGRDVLPTDGLNVDSEHGYLYLRAMLAEALR